MDSNDKGKLKKTDKGKINKTDKVKPSGDKVKPSGDKVKPSGDKVKPSGDKDKRDIPDDKFIQVPLYLLMRFRNIFEITNAQMHWKTQDLLPVGVVIRDIDQIISNNTTSK
tara:strand:+ start:4607 stop:4939 length:333 start_codon:yes stop_codon:yes gene_type:complete